MTTKEYIQIRNKAQKFFHEWRLNLGLRWWQVTLRTHDERFEDNGDCNGTCRVDWEYLYATIDLYLSNLVGKSDKEIEELVVHELCHILVNEMREFAPEKMEGEELKKAMKHEERVVSCLTNAFLWTKYAHKPKDPGKKNKKVGK